MKFKFKPINLVKLYNFISRLSKREKIIFYFTFVVLCVVIIDRLIIIPIHSKISKLNEEIKEKELKIKEALHILGQKEKIVYQLKQYSNFLKNIASEEEQLTMILKEIESLANKNNVYLIDLKPAGTKSKENSLEYLVSLTLEAKIDSLFSFMYEIENSTLILSIKKYQITPKSTRPYVSCNMIVSKLVIP